MPGLDPGIHEGRPRGRPFSFTTKARTDYIALLLAPQILPHIQQSKPMIASRLVTIAKDLAEEYQRFGLTELLQHASQVSANRPNLNQGQYSNAVGELKRRARDILEQNVFRTYPLDTLRLLSNSDISSILPTTIANLIIGGFPDRKEAAISSAEINMYLSEAHNLLGQINGFLQFNSRLGVRKYDVPQEKVALDVKIPRAVFHNELGLFEQRLSHFSNFFRSVTELVTGSRENAELIYLSTTDPIISLAVLGPVAYGILKFYKLFLEVAEKHISLYRAIRELKGSKLESLDFAEMEKGIYSRIKSSVEEAVSEAFANVLQKVPQERASELKVEITKQSIEIVTDITKGARIFVSLESQQQVELLVDKEPERVNEVRAEIEQQKLLESRLDSLATEFSEKPAVLSHIAGS
jgi:hypothetical protein